MTFLHGQSRGESPKNYQEYFSLCSNFAPLGACKGFLMIEPLENLVFSSGSGKFAMNNFQKIASRARFSFKSFLLKTSCRAGGFLNICCCLFLTSLLLRFHFNLYCYIQLDIGQRIKTI